MQQCATESVSRFLLPSIMFEIVNLVTTLASDTTVKVFEKVRWVLRLGCLDHWLGSFAERVPPKVS